MIKLVDKSVSYDDNFKLVLSTRLTSPNFAPEIFSKTLVINFCVTSDGLAAQLLNAVVAHERPDLEQQYAALVRDIADSAALILQLEDTLLRELSSAAGNILDNEELIKTLATTQQSAAAAAEALEKSKHTQAEISKARSAFVPVAHRGSILYFLVASLSTINPMYETSLDSFLTVFHTAMDLSKADPVLESRIRIMLDTITREIYDFTCTGIFERHRLLFSFQLAAKLDANLTKPELDFFLKGDTGLSDPSTPSPVPWLAMDRWKDLAAVAEASDVFQTIVDDVKKRPAIWKAWYDLEAPEKEELPCLVNTTTGEKPSGTMTALQKLCAMRCFRVDRVFTAAKLYVIQGIGEKYVTPPTLDYRRIFKQSKETTPMIFILSPGADPQSDIQRLATDKGFQAKFRFIALGQGQGPKAEELIEFGTSKGYWVLLQNCHLLVSCSAEIKLKFRSFVGLHFFFSDRLCRRSKL